jgi:hypothetical protein
MLYPPGCRVDGDLCRGKWLFTAGGACHKQKAYQKTFHVFILVR